MNERMMKAALLGKRRLEALVATIPEKDRAAVESRLPMVDGVAEVARLERIQAEKPLPAPVVEADPRG